jgi:hypothetical protein
MNNLTEILYFQTETFSVFEVSSSNSEGSDLRFEE